MALNPHRPKCRIKLFAGVDTTKYHSSGKKGSWRRWQVVKLGPTADVPSELVMPLVTRWVVLHIALCLDAQQQAMGEPEIYVAPWQRITKASNKVALFILAVGPQDIASSERHVLPCRRRDTHLNGYLSKVFAEYFGLHKIELMQRYFPVVVQKAASTATPIAETHTPKHPPSTTSNKPPSYTNSKTAAASRTGLRQERKFLQAQLDRLESVAVLEKELGKAQDLIIELKEKVLNFEKAAKERRSGKRKRAPANRKVPQHISKNFAENTLSDYYENYSKVSLCPFFFLPCSSSFPVFPLHASHQLF